MTVKAYVTIVTVQSCEGKLEEDLNISLFYLASVPQPW